MSMFNLGNDVVQEVEKDTLGGGVFDSDIYDLKVEMAYLSKAKSGAMAINLTFKSNTGKSLRVTEYISSGDAKGNSFTYVDKEGNKKPLPGYAKLDTLCKLAIGKGLGEIEPEKKTIKLYDVELKKEVPKEVPVLLDLLGADITCGVLKVIEDKSAKDASGEYVPTGETREVNEVDKMFRTSDHLTVAEIVAEATEAEFYSKWLDKNKGKVVNKAKGTSGASNKPASAPAAKAPTKSLFS